ncbi:hypothetical protein DYH10_00625 [Candidatus Saccharibacteria bacterium CPR2]|nr:hypothetical protein [Candidatus Saccharibacteria bacterium CPR2]
MIYIYGLIFALQLVLGQAFWKVAVEKNHFSLTSDFIFSKKILLFLTSPSLILGIVFYLSATILNMWMLSKYQLSSIQLITIPLTLILMLTVGWKIFGDSISTVNLLGIVILIVGVSLATLK